MNRVTFILLLVMAMLMAFVEGRGLTREGIFGTRIDVLPVLVTYAALRGDLFGAVALAAFSGILLDGLSTTPLGTSLLSLSLAAVVVVRLRGVILRDQALAQAAVGGTVATLSPVLNLGILWGLGLSPVAGWGTVLHVGVLGVSGVILSPFIFLLFDWLEAELTFEEEPFSRFRSEVEIKRGRG
ncbi:MAG: hypothetical protein M2R45_00832 [Verrucomicrobia subdivision 3 bacterium]|nr:hypothetical protein [Limisphaerales bacterium]MCS1413062.1 hypothetical protein [Limisphaerales bacterium]